MLRRIGPLSLVALLLMVLVPTLGLSSRARAAEPNCGENQGDAARWAVGYGSSDTYPEFLGAQAVNRTRAGAVCKDKPYIWNYVEIIVRVSNWYRSRWVSAGHRVLGHTNQRFIWASYRAASSGNPMSAVGPATGVGGLHTYTVGWRDACQCLVAKWDGGDLAETGINPYNWERPSRVDWIGSATYRRSDVPGSPSARSHFDQIQAQRQSDRVWIASPCGRAGFNDSRSKWASVAAACNDAEVWTYNTCISCAGPAAVAQELPIVGRKRR
jgi:hypothetical protein